ncbi:MAG: enoyl-CoA hydratase/isomerase family protein [Pseudomonadota bacterium]
MPYEHIAYSVDGHIGIITINRPDVMNALSFQTHQELARAIAQADENDEVRVIVITGSGRAFCSGDDVNDIFLNEDSPARKYQELQLGYLQKETIEGGGSRLLTINKPTIAAVNGPAVGYGCDISLMCDIRVASEKAKFGEVFLRVGLVPDEAQLILPRLVGLAKAYELMLTTDIIDAREAEKIGLVNTVVPHQELMPAALALARKIADKPPIAVKLTKEGVRRGLNMPIETWKQWYSQTLLYCFTTEDHKEGARAFIEKRSPVFKGK